MGPTAPIEKHSSWNTPRSSKRVRSFPEIPTPRNCTNACLDQPKTEPRCRLDNLSCLPSRLRPLDSGYWRARPTGRLPPQQIDGLSLQQNYSRVLRLTSCLSNRLTKPTRATSPSRICTMPAKRRRFFRNTAKRSTNWLIVCHGEPQSSIRPHRPASDYLLHRPAALRVGCQ